MSQTQRTIKTLSLFSGAGGLDIGFAQAGYDIRACIEIEAAYCDTLVLNHRSGAILSGESRIICEDIRQVDPRQFLDENIECIIGGPPCQTFSAAGRRSGGVLGTSDLRGRLFESYCLYLETLKPKAFIFENVYGLPGANGGGPWREICDAFSSLGYNLTADVLDAADYGVPQHRERLFIVGIRRGQRSFRFPAPTHGPDSPSGKELVSIQAAIQDLQSDAEPYHELDGLYGHLLSQVPEGLNYSFFTQEMGYPEPRFAWRSKFHDFLYKVDKSQPARTIKAQPGKFTGPFHWKNRHFTAEELKRLQTFPDAYAVAGSSSKVMEQIGNSVPPRLAHVLAVSLREQVLAPIKSLTYPERPVGFSSTFRQRQRERTKDFKKTAAVEIAKRFPNVQDISTIKAQKQAFYVSFENRFEKSVHIEESADLFGQTQFKVNVALSQKGISVDVRQLNLGSKKALETKLTLKGLKKYISIVDDLCCEASIGNIDDLFKVWGIVQDALVARSRFFTLIDIYGHYANRGDAVTVKTELSAAPKDVVARAIEFFGDSNNCGKFIKSTDLSEELAMEESELPELLRILRTLRWDVRDRSTHSTITQDGMICTYPFPLLSSRAQFERRPIAINERV